jgi:hypothetical protein
MFGVFVIFLEFLTRSRQGKLSLPAARRYL